MPRAPLSVIIPTLDAAETLPAALAALAAANEAGLIRDVVVSDGGSTDRTADIAEAAGCTVLTGPPGRGGQLVRGAEAARGEWLLFLHADTMLEEGWSSLAAAAMAAGEAAFVFRLRFSTSGFAPAAVSLGANMRARLLRLPYGDQGLLISKAHYARLGGYAPLPLFEDVDFVRRIVGEGGRRALRILPADAVTSAIRYEREGYVRRVAKNQLLLLSYLGGTAPAQLKARYG